jgi:hypothetical protein
MPRALLTALLLTAAEWVGLKVCAAVAWHENH